MAKDIAIGKRAKITEAQQYMILAVLGAAVVLGVALALVIHFIKQISFNAGIISEEDKAIAKYSDTIKSIGICRSPKGTTYTTDELKKCSPDSIEVSEIPGTLRYNILVQMAANQALNSVQKESSSSCINPITGKNYTYSELNELYSKAETSDELNAASQLIRFCSALRIIPEALPAFKNEEALLSSLNKIFIISGWEPDNLSPTGNSGSADFGTNLNTISVSLSITSDSDTTMRVLDNIERSIRQFNIERATISWEGDGYLGLQAQASAYYMTQSSLKETTKTIKAKGDKK